VLLYYIKLYFWSTSVVDCAKLAKVRA